MSLDDVLEQRLAEHRKRNLYRSHRILSSAQGARVQVDGRQLLCFCSNDYLSLANHPEVVAALATASATSGVGSGAAHLVCGHSEQHHLLEQELAQFTGRERALLFSTGYMANLGAIVALLGRKDEVFEDRLNHASLLDGARLSGARMWRFAHNDVADLRRRLELSTAPHKLIAVDGVFSMDGDLAPLPEVVALADEFDAWLMVDDAHGLGCMGAHGGGVCELYSLGATQVPILMGTLGKAFGTFGAFVAGSEALIEALIQFARTYIYTTAMPPAVAAATRASLRLIREDTQRRERLQARVGYFRLGTQRLNLPVLASTSAIQPILLGSEQRALQWAHELWQQGCWVSAIRPPTVPNGTARLRVTITADHSEKDIDQLLSGLLYCLERW